MIKTWALAACIGIAAIVTGVSAVAQQNFTAEQAATFNSECVAGGGDATLCQCVWNGVQTGMTAPEFASFDAAVRSENTHPSMGKYELIVGRCNGTNRATASNPEAYPGHTSTNFMNGCISGGVSQAICACSMNRFERELPLQTFAELDHMMRWNKGPGHPHYTTFVRIVQECARANP